MPTLKNYLSPGTLIMLLGVRASSFAQSFKREIENEKDGLTVVVLNASDRSLPALLDHTHPRCITIIVADATAPEPRCLLLVECADVVVRSVNEHRARVVRLRNRPTIEVAA
jgi:hypothetical protein